MGNTQRREEVERHVRALIAEGAFLSCKEVMRRMGRNDDRAIRKDWDELAAEGRVPRRPRPGDQDVAPQRVEKWEAEEYRPSGPAGKMLVEVEQRYRAFIERVRTTDELHRTEAAVQWWGDKLTAISQLHKEAEDEIYGRSIDHLIEEFHTSLGTGSE